MAYVAETKIYERVFRAGVNQDFYSYRNAKKLLRNRTARSTLEVAAEHHCITGSKHDRGRSLIKEAGIYPFAFLSASGEVEMLENPLKLIQKKLDDIGAVWH